jgi:hypothetical protein
VTPIEEQVIEDGIVKKIVRHAIIENNEKIWIDYLLGVLTKIIDKFLLFSNNVVENTRRVTIKDIV